MTPAWVSLLFILMLVMFLLTQPHGKYSRIMNSATLVVLGLMLIVLNI